MSGCWVVSLGLLRDVLREESGLVTPLNGVALVGLSVDFSKVEEALLSSFLASKLDWPSLVVVAADLVSKEDVSVDFNCEVEWLWLVRSVEFNCEVEWLWLVRSVEFNCEVEWLWLVRSVEFNCEVEWL